MNPVVIILVAGTFEVPVERCCHRNDIGAECGALVSDMAEHIEWHKSRARGIPKRVCYCAAGDHEYLKAVDAPSTASCQAHILREPTRQKTSPRMLATGKEKNESIRAA